MLSVGLLYSAMEVDFHSQRRSTMSKFENNAVTWFEIPTTDFERATRFYESMLDAKLRAFPGPEPCNMFPSGDGGVGGCIIHRPHHKPSPDGTSVYLNVDGKLDASL